MLSQSAEKPFRIVEVDRDYHRVTDMFTKYFNSLEEAEKWADEQNWSAYYYYVWEDSK